MEVNIDMESFKSQFKDEALKIFATIDEKLAQLKQNNQNSENINSLYRSFHSLKGGGTMFGFPELSDFNQHLESLLFKYRENSSVIPQTVILLIEESQKINHELLNEIQLTDNTLFERKSHFIQKILSLE